MSGHRASLEEPEEQLPAGDGIGDRAAEQQASSESLLRPAADASKEGRSSQQEVSVATNAATLPDGWPAKPQKLGEITPFTVLSFVADAVLVLAPVTFIALGIVIWSLNGQPTEGNRLGKRVEAAVRLGPTVFPILFAAVVSRSLKMIGRRLAQDSVKLGTLELLLASRSVWGTVESQVLLRRCTLVGVHLLLLWSLSPLGGQASLRALEKAPKTARNTTTVRYLHTGADAAIFARDTLVGDRHNQIYISALTATRGMKLASMDTWGNVRVPRLDGLNASSASDPSGWQDVPPVTQPEQYSSLLGIPVVGLPADRAAAADFTLVTSYMALSCAPWQTFAITSNAWKPYLGRVWQPPASNLSSSARNATGRQWRPFHSNKFAGASSYSYFFDTDQPLQSYARNNRSAGDPPRRVNFGTVIAGSPRIGVTSCAVTRIDAEVAVRCSASAGAGAGAGPDCRAVHMRAASQSSAASPSPSSPALSDDNDDDDDARSTSASSRRISTNTTTPLDYGAVTTQLFQEISAVEQGKFDDPSLTERVLNDTSSLYMAQNYQMNLTSIPPSVFSPRLSLVLNTYYLSMLPRFSGAFLGEGAQGNAFLSGRDFGNASQSATAFDPSFVQIACPVFCYRSAEARVARAHEAYRVNAAWLALLLASAGVLFGVGCAGAALGWRGTHVPDMLGYVASMTYNNPYVPLPDHDGGQGSSDDSRGESGRGEGRGDSSGEAGEGSGERGGSSGGVLDAMDRARLLRDMRVTIGDVHGAGEGVGHVAFARSGPDVRRLEKGRLYT